jgi:hypothetical protein
MYSKSRSLCQSHNHWFSSSCQRFPWALVLDPGPRLNYCEAPLPPRTPIWYGVIPVECHTASTSESLATSSWVFNWYGISKPDKLEFASSNPQQTHSRRVHDTNSHSRVTTEVDEQTVLAYIPALVVLFRRVQQILCVRCRWSHSEWSTYSLKILGVVMSNSWFLISGTTANIRRSCVRSRAKTMLHPLVHYPSHVPVVGCINARAA